MAKDEDGLLRELRAIKLLLMLQLQRQGVRQREIASMLGISERTLGRMLPASAAKGGKGPLIEED